MQRLFTLIFLLFCLNLQAQIYEDISVEEAISLIDANSENPAFTILDVRTPEEYEPAHIENSFNRNYYDTDFEQQMDSLNKERIYLIYCQSGGRSGASLQLMESLGFQTVYNMLGGMNSWDAANHPTTDIAPVFIDLTAPLEPQVNTSSLDVEELEIELYPMPASDFVYFEFQNFTAIKSWQISDISGRILHESSITSTEKKKILDVRLWQNGIYFYQLFDTEKKALKSGRIVVSNQ